MRKLDIFDRFMAAALGTFTAIGAYTAFDFIDNAFWSADTGGSIEDKLVKGALAAVFGFYSHKFNVIGMTHERRTSGSVREWAENLKPKDFGE